jgi:hypothetical protein
MAPRSTAPALFLALPIALGACGDDAEVPFGREVEEAAGQTETATGGAATIPDDFEPIVGRALPAGSRSVAVEGAPLESGDADLRALLTEDFDDDGDRDALVLRVDDSAAHVAFARRDGSTFGTLRQLGEALPARDGCEVTTAELSTISPTYAVARTVRTCEEDESDESLWILSVEGTPRAYEQIVLLPPEGRAEGDVTVALRVVDRDEDGHLDALLDVTVRTEDGGEPARASMAWLDRPSGLARDTAEPEASLGAIAESARETIGRDPEAALPIARRALALHAVLCREAGAPRLRFGSTDGLACGSSVAAGRAAAVATAALARSGDVWGALAAAERLDEDGYDVSGADRNLANQALEAMATTDGVTAWQGPTVTPPPGPPVRLPLVAFLDDDRLLVHGDPAQIIDLAAPESAPETPHQGTSEVLTDPTGELAVTSIERTCDGYVLSIVRASDVVAGVVAGRPLSTPLLAPKAPPPGARCPTLPADVRQDDGGYRVVGWAPQGVVAVRKDEVRVVPLTVDGRAAGAPRGLGDDDPTPAPILGGGATPDGSAYALATAYGIAVHQRGIRTLLLRPSDWSADGISPQDVVVSPNVTRVAFVRSGRVRALHFPGAGQR